MMAPFGRTTGNRPLHSICFSSKVLSFLSGVLSGVVNVYCFPKTNASQLSQLCRTLCARVCTRIMSSFWQRPNISTDFEPGSSLPLVMAGAEANASAPVKDLCLKLLSCSLASSRASFLLWLGWVVGGWSGCTCFLQEPVVSESDIPTQVYPKPEVPTASLYSAHACSGSNSAMLDPPGIAPRCVRGRSVSLLLSVEARSTYPLQRHSVGLAHRIACTGERGANPRRKPQARSGTNQGSPRRKPQARPGANPRLAQAQIQGSPRRKPQARPGASPSGG